MFSKGVFVLLEVYWILISALVNFWITLGFIICHGFKCSFEVVSGVVMMELPHYLFLLARTPLSTLDLLSMEPPQSPKFNMPLWQPWIASPHKGINHFFECII